jgi:hypothetical protein
VPLPGAISNRQLEVAVPDEAAPYGDVYRFFGRDVSLRSDVPEILTLFKAIYRRFWVGHSAGAEAPFYMIAGDRPFGQPAVVADGRLHLIDAPELLIGYAYTCILNAILAQVDTHFVIHGGALSVDGRGILLPANSGLGKTTLVLALVKRGCQFLSDELIAIRRGSRCLDPFPKSLGVRHESLPLIGDLDLSDQTRLPLAGGLAKWMVDIEHVRRGSVGGPCPGKYLLVLTTSPEEDRPDSEGVLYLVLDKVNEALLADLRAIVGVRSLLLRTGRAFPILRFDLEGKAFVLPEIEDTCDRHQALVLDTLLGEEKRPDFQVAPQLIPIRKSEAAMALLRRFRGGYRSMLLQQGQGSVLRLFLELLDVVKDMKCYYLVVGRLGEMVDLICDLVGQEAR